VHGERDLYSTKSQGLKREVCPLKGGETAHRTEKIYISSLNPERERSFPILLGKEGGDLLRRFVLTRRVRKRSEGKRGNLLRCKGKKGPFNQGELGKTAASKTISKRYWEHLLFRFQETHDPGGKKRRKRVLPFWRDQKKERKNGLVGRKG